MSFVPSLGEPGVVGVRRSLVGLVLKIARDPLNAVPPAAFAERMVVARALGRVAVYVSDPELLHEALLRNADRLEKSDDMKRVLGIALGDGLLSADGAVWRWQRQALAPAFQHDRLTKLVPTMIAAAEATRDRWLALPPNSVIDLGREMMRTTYKIIIETMLAGSDGIDADGVERSLSDYLRATPWLFAFAFVGLPYWLPFPGRGKAMRAIAFMRSAVKAKVAARRPSDSGADDLIGMLLTAADPETGRRLDDEEITDNILTFIAAGHETTALALSWTCALLAHRPDCTERLVAEIEAVTGGGPVQPQHIASLAYARQVVSEAMRLYPPAPIIARTVRRDFALGGVPLPAGSTVFAPIYALHRHEGLWDRPEEFDPARFSPEATKGRHRFAYLPFGAGPRVCIGNSFAMMEAVAILAVLARTFVFRPIEAELPGARMQVTLRPKRPLMVQLHRR